ncbi:MAG: hypothetical protein KDC88_16020 [Ignavibacteriae bacterium]|nr:hypothetical protein [Ignavibacteriota bacterium]MCB9208181.1 hypothetical protein [Ignavibacteriales bacterium]MCB9258947.1 hypothetical protein [Ignavibacteriales bacterium]
MTQNEIISWLLKGDVSIQYQTYRDLLSDEKKSLRSKIEKEGWGKKYLSLRKPNDHWGMKFYQPKWTSTHYTLLELKNLNILPSCQPVLETLKIILEENINEFDGGINPIGSIKKSDVCINGMALNYFSYFKVDEEKLKSIIDFILAEKMNDGGFNCHSNRKGAIHSSLHTTLSVLEGIFEYRNNGYTYRLKELLDAEKQSQEFILMHRLFKSDKSNKIIKNSFLKLAYPTRWYYDILRALDYFRSANINFDERMQDAIDVILKKRTKEGLWKLQSHHPGLRHFDMEEVGKPSRWNTLRALRVLKHFKKL